IGVWSCTVEPKKGLTVDPPAAIRITNIALGDVLADSSARTTLKLTTSSFFFLYSLLSLNFLFSGLIIPDESDDEADEPAEQPKSSTFICALTPGKIEQVTTNLVLEDKEEYVFEVVGPNTVYLTGNYIDQRPLDMSPFDDDDSDDDEDAYNLQDVSSDVEMDPNDLDDEARFEEIDEAVHGSGGQTLKRGRDSDAGEADKLSKKQKAEGGKAVKPDAPETSDKKEKKKEKKEKKKEGKEKDAGRPTAKSSLGGVKVKDTKVGTGPAAKKGNTVSMRYIGKLQSGKVFDSNTKGKPVGLVYVFSLVFAGWDEGIVGMHVGGERILTIPPAMGYGKRGTDGIPGNSTLIFDVKLTDLK
ncbi:hypothetical protein B0H13DRAFT_1976761, partial [Mycena leptocephala]